MYYDVFDSDVPDLLYVPVSLRVLRLAEGEVMFLAYSGVTEG